MKGRRHGGRGAASALEDNSGLIDLATLDGIDSHGDPISGLQRKATIGRLDAPAMPRIEPRRGTNWVAVAVVLTGAMLALGAVVGALVVREMAANAPVEVAAAAPTPVQQPTAATSRPEPPAPRPAAAAPPPEPEPEPEAAATPEARDDAPAVAPDERGERRKADRDERKRRRARKLPAKPDRSTILSGMARVTPRIRSCARGMGGVVSLQMVINGPRGKVRSVDASGVPASIERCVERAAKRARFKPFADERFRVRYPLKL